MMKYCSNCGSSVTWKIPPDDDRERAVCDACNRIHYSNPRIIAGCIPVRGEKILICKRAIEPRKGWWTLPAGFMENGETVEQAAARETWEEARAKVAIGGLQTVMSIPHINQVYMIFRAEMQDEQHKPGPESEATKLVSWDEIPWKELAFPVMRRALEDWHAKPAETCLSKIDLGDRLKKSA